MAIEPSGAAVADPTYLIHTFEHRAYPLTGGRSLTIGRDTDCDIVVNEVFVSRHHAELRPEGNDYVLHPVGANPTLLNDEPMTAPHPLQEGDAFLVGTMKFVFTRERLPVAMTIASADALPAPRATTGVDDRRPTLMLRITPVGSSPQSGNKRLVWLLVVVLIVLVVLAYSVR